MGFFFIFRIFCLRKKSAKGFSLAFLLRCLMTFGIESLSLLLFFVCVFVNSRWRERNGKINYESLRILIVKVEKVERESDKSRRCEFKINRFPVHGKFCNLWPNWCLKPFMKCFIWRFNSLIHTSTWLKTCHFSIIKSAIKGFLSRFYQSCTTIDIALNVSFQLFIHFSIVPDYFHQFLITSGFIEA